LIGRRRRKRRRRRRRRRRRKVYSGRGGELIDNQKVTKGR